LSGVSACSCGLLAVVPWLARAVAAAVSKFYEFLVAAFVKRIGRIAGHAVGLATAWAANPALKPIHLRPVLWPPGVLAALIAERVLMRGTGLAQDQVTASAKRIDPHLAVRIGAMVAIAVPVFAAMGHHFSTAINLPLRQL